jgi:hypothetical protein
MWSERKIGPCPPGAQRPAAPRVKRHGTYSLEQGTEVGPKMAQVNKILGIPNTGDHKVTFRKADKSDLPASLSLFVASLTISESLLKTRLSWLDKNPDLFYIVEHGGEIVGFTAMIPLLPKKIHEILNSNGLKMCITSDEIDEFKPGKPLHVYISTMRTKPNISILEKRSYGVRLVGGVISVLINMLEKGVSLSTIYAKSEAIDGMKILKHVGFSEFPSITESKNYILKMDKVGQENLVRFRRLFPR